MNDQIKTEPSISKRSTTRHLFRWLSNSRRIRRALIVLLWTATLVALLHGEENWRGRRAWNQYREAAEARGLSLDFKSYIPKPVPDDQNFAATPFLKSFSQNGPLPALLTNDPYALAENNIGATQLAKGRRHFTDLAAWQLAFAALQNGPLKREQKFQTDETGLAARAAAAPAVLEAMKPDAAVFAELRAASTREFSRYPVVYNAANPMVIMLPHLSKLKMVCLRLNLQACAELAAGQNDAALADVKLMLSLADSIKSEPFLISFLVRAACVQIAIQPVWEGLAEHRWTDAQLQQLQARFLAYDFLADTQLPLKGERAAGLLMADLVREFSLGRGSLAAAAYWPYQEKLNYSKLFDVEMDGSVDLAAKTVSPSRVASNAGELTRQTYGGLAGSDFRTVLHHRILASILLSSKGNPAGVAARGQTSANQAALGCALERYRLAGGQFPETLEALAPRFISAAPNDVIAGRPYQYRRAGDGQFILYSIGWNEKDDGGVPGKALFDQTQGDWVWSYRP